MSTETFKGMHQRPYSERATGFRNPCARELLACMARKHTNLCVALDITDMELLLTIADEIGSHVCAIKTHVDMIDDFEYSRFATRIAELAEKHDFLIFEDRKFADIGQTVRNQYARGIYRIRDWSHFTNAHPIPGDGIVDGLAAEGLSHGRGLLLLAEMSTKGTLARGEYSRETLAMACRHQDFVFGFIGQRRMDLATAGIEGISAETTDFLYLTPGVNLAVKGDDLGQQYNTPESVIDTNDCDVIIVGRGIVGATDRSLAAKTYREAGWKAYLTKMKRFGFIEADI